MEVSNPGLEGFDTVLGGLFGLGGGVTLERKLSLLRWRSIYFLLRSIGTFDGLILKVFDHFLNFEWFA